MSKDNLARVIETANGQDKFMAERAWTRYSAIVGKIAAKHAFPLRTGAGVFAALSPNNDYFGNLRDTDRVLAAARGGHGIDSFKVSTYGANKRKAWQIAQGTDPLDLIVFPKTRNFFLNIVDPTDPVPVTVDGHIFNAWTGERIPLNVAAQKLRARFYDQVAEDIRALGTELNIIPNVVQGLIWYGWKRAFMIRHTMQMEFWGSDYIAAGLGFDRDTYF